MRRFLQSVGIVLIMNVFALCLLLFFSRGHLNANNVTQKLDIAVCQQEICIKGIVPNVTTWHDTEKTLSIPVDVNLNDYPYNYMIDAEDSSYDLRFWMNFDKTTNVVIEIKPNSTSIRVADLLLDLGSPCGLTITDNIASFQYPRLVFEVPLNKLLQAPGDYVFTPLSPVNVVSFEKASCSVPLAYPAAKNVFVLWCGFASFERYTNDCLNKSDMR